MGDHRTQQECDGALLNARAVVDAGGESPDLLIDVLYRRLRDLAVDEVVEIVSHQSASHTAVLSWCHLTGQVLIQVRQVGAQTQLWIRKARPLANEVRTSPFGVTHNERSV